MQDDLVERVARVLVNGEPDGVCVGPRHYRMARSIIPIVLEETLSSVRSEHLTDPQDDSDHAYMRALHDAEREIRAKMENLT